MALIKRFPLTSYFVLAYVFTWAIEIPMMLTARGMTTLHLPHWLEAVAAFGPFAAAIVVLRVTGGPADVKKLFLSLMHWRVPPLWFAATILSPFVVLFAALIQTGELALLLNGDICRGLIDAGKFAELIFLGSIIRGIGEEPGWRGFALPVLRGRHGPLLATLLLWPVWACWHLPSFLMRPEFALGAWIGFSIGILAATAWTTLLYDYTRSVLMIAIWHALINITRGMAGAASTDAFFAFAQAMIVIGLMVIIYWIIVRPGKYEASHGLQ